MQQHLNKQFIEKRSYLFLATALFILFSFQAGAQHKTVGIAQSELNEQMKNSKEPTITILYYFRQLHEEDFATKQEWLDMLEQLEKTAGENPGGYYAQVCWEIGDRLYKDSDFREAYYYLYKAQKEIEVSEPKDKRFLSDFHQSLGLSYLYFKRYNDARTQFLVANNFKEVTEKDRIGILNTLGLINREQGYLDSAKIYYERALVIAKKTDYEAWIAVLSGNLGHYYWTKKEYAKARYLTSLDYRISLKTDQRGSAINALSLLIDIDLHEKSTAAAQAKLSELEKLVGSEYNIQHSRVYYRARTSVLEAAGQYKEALESYRSVVRYSDTLNRLSDIENLKKTEFQIDFERKQAELSLLQEKKKRDELVIYGLTGITIVAFIIFGVILNLVAKRRKRDKEIALLEHAQFERELSATDKEMRKILSNLIEKNQLVEQLTNEIDQFHSSDSQPNEEKIKLLDKLQSFTLLTDDDWLDFKKLFEKLNPGFFTRVLSHFPDLTNAEIRLTTLIKLNLSNLEMARALGISPDSVRKTSLRLRKKLEMEHHEDLVKFILTL